MIFAEDIRSAVSKAECERLAELARGARVLEMGSYLGRSTITFASVAVHVHAVDWHRGDEHAGVGGTLQPFMENVRRYGVQDRVTVHVGRFGDALPAFRPFMFDLAFIDGCHDLEEVANDITLALPLLRGGGYLALHDYGLFDVADACALALDREPDEVVDTLAVYRLL